MDDRVTPRLRRPGEAAAPVQRFERVVVVGDQAWTLALLRAKGRIEAKGLVLDWQPGQNSIHDRSEIGSGRDVGNVTVQRRTAQGLEDVAHDVTFAFAFSAFRPGGTLHDQ